MRSTTTFGTIRSAILSQSESGIGHLSMYPDFWIQNREEDVVLVGDTKWKTGTEPSRDNFYQIAAYQAKYGTQGC
ncbi:hypothetical protein E2L06_19605 [Haloterrigena sp. H1]|nr:hypothetical protein E2L06_19605 [Haloterrigena sp. H1]